MKETGLTGKGRSTTIAATPDDGKSQRKRRRRRRIIIHILDCSGYSCNITKADFLLHPCLYVIQYTIYVICFTYIFHVISQ